MLAAVAGVLVAGGCGASTTTSQRTVLPITPTTQRQAAPPTTTAAVVPQGPPPSTLVATTKGSITGHPAPGAPSDRVVPGDWYGYPSVLPVIAQQPGWVEVRLAQRPNQSTTWVQDGDVTLASTSYRIVIDLRAAHLAVYRDGQEILNLPAGVGTEDDPTVPGNYFVTMRVPPPSPAYGPFVLVTSAHSEKITDWERSGDAIIAIHGPIDASADRQIGINGARISHGCVRLHDADLAQLGTIPPGSPIEITT